jgi:hypothetical protein
MKKHGWDRVYESKLDRFMNSLIDKIECVGKFIVVLGFIYLILQLLRVWL